MNRRTFVTATASLPLVGPATAWALGGLAATAPAAAADVRGGETGMASVLWSYLDHASSWDEAVADLRRYVGDGHADAEMLGGIADLIERELAAVDGQPLEGVLGFFPGVVLMLHGLRSLGDYGDAATFDAQSAFVRRLVRAL
jgi:hypothetical protein